MTDRDYAIQLAIAIEDRNPVRIQQLCRERPKLISDHMYDDDDTTNIKKSWIICAALAIANTGDYRVVEAMLDVGFNINALNLPEGASVIDRTIGKCDIDLLSFLLMKGADPNLSRPAIAALNCERKELRLPMIKLLLDHGLNINNQFELYGEKDKLFTALDWASAPEIIEFLKSHGAKKSAEICRETSLSTSAEREKDWTFAQDVCMYFNENVGAVSERSQTEIVPTGEQIDIYAVEPDNDRKHLTLFTVGLSAMEMGVPEGKEDFALAELYIELPADWPFDQLNDARHVWPALWLRKIGRYPREHGTWLGGPLTIIANDDPPQPLAEGIPFTCWMLFADKSFERSDGRTVKLYRLLPLYAEERALEMREGAPALLRAFDRVGAPFVVDVHRKNVGLNSV